MRGYPDWCHGFGEPWWWGLGCVWQAKALGPAWGASLAHATGPTSRSPRIPLLSLESMLHPLRFFVSVNSHHISALSWQMSPWGDWVQGDSTVVSWSQTWSPPWGCPWELLRVQTMEGALSPAEPVLLGAQHWSSLSEGKWHFPQTGK